MKVIIIGAVAAGTSAAAQIMRNDKEADVVIYEKDRDISYSACGFPYHIGGKVGFSDVVPRTPASFSEKYGVQVHSGHEVTKIDPAAKKVFGQTDEGNAFEDDYDELIMATGAQSMLPDLPGSDDARVFTLRTAEDTRAIMEYMEEKQPQNAVIVGTGFIGLEVLENLLERKIHVTVLNRSDKITPHLDADMAKHLEDLLRTRGVDLRKNTEIKAITKTAAYTGEEQIPADLILFATGVRPNTKIAEEAGVALGDTGGIVVDDALRTNVAHIYACGDCAQLWSQLDKEPMYVPLGTSANKTGKIAGDVLTGGSMRFQGILGTSIFRLFDLTIGATGYTEKKAKDLGYDTEIICQKSLHRAGYFSGEPMEIKAVVDKKSRTLLGVQLIGTKGVDKRLDVLVTAIKNKMDGDALYNLDLSYAPPYNAVHDPVHYIGLKMRGLSS